jgi:hypothetical protein
MGIVPGRSFEASYTSNGDLSQLVIGKAACGLPHIQTIINRLRGEKV